MTKAQKIKRATLGTALAAALAAGFAASAPTRALAQPGGAVAPSHDVTLSVGAGRLVRMSAPISDLVVANDEIADVYVRSPNQIYIFGKAAGNTTVYATGPSGRVVYSANVRVGQNLGSVDQLLQQAMPEADITATPLNGTVLLTGTVAQPADAAEAEQLVQAFVGEAVRVVSRLRTATPQQVMLQVRFAEVNRSLVREIGTNLLSRDQTGGFSFGIGRGVAGSITDRVSDTLVDPLTGNPQVLGTNYNFNLPGATTTLGAAGRLLGIDILSTLNLGETTGQVTTLAEPTLVSLSGETASFLAGGEFPIPVSQSLGTVTIEYKQYGVGLAFTPTVLEDGRISIRVRPEVSELSTVGSIRLNNFEVPALVTRRAETTVELGSGQSFMIGGLLRNHNTNFIDRAPGLGNIPILGTLFRSTRYRREETELVIVVTPYLVRPVSASQIALPTDGYRNADEAQRLLLGQGNASVPGEQRPGPTSAEPRTVAPGVGPVTGDAAPAVPNRAPPVREARRPAALPPQGSGRSSAQPGFNF
jgi:pilus assembly protein CpaC